MRIRAPAKINLHLRVGPPRANGYHPLLNWMCKISLFDELEFEGGSGDRAGGCIELTCDDPAIPTGADNLIIKAATALGAAGRSANIKLLKRIPVGGGLAGGSSDAAHTLVGLNRLWTLNRTNAELAATAARIGSDIPFFFSGPSSVCTGLGEVVRPIRPPNAKWAVLICPPYGMPTPKVYRRFDELGLGAKRAIEEEPNWQDWAESPAEKLLTLLVNDLEKPAFDLNPALGDLRVNWEKRLKRTVRMSGSGSTLFTLYDTPGLAEVARNGAVSKASAGEYFHVVELAPPTSD